MEKEVICHQLQTVHQDFTQYILSLATDQLEYAHSGKWSAVQQAEHIYKSVRPLALGLRLPKFFIKLVWGKANRPSKTYEELVQKYKDKLQQGGRASSPYVPQNNIGAEAPAISQKIHTAVNRLQKNIGKYSETDLDKFILPHPLLGKVTLREMLYFTIYHVQHHGQLIATALQQKKH